MYDPPLRHSRTLSRISERSHQEDLLPNYPVSAKTSSETLRPPKEASEDVKKELAEGSLGVDGFIYEASAPYGVEVRLLLIFDSF